MTGHAFIDLGKRYSPCAIAAAHDGKHVVEDNHGWRDAKEKAPTMPKQAAPIRPPKIAGR